MPLDVLQPAGYALPDFLKRAIVWPRPGDGSFVSMHYAFRKNGTTSYPGVVCRDERDVGRFLNKHAGSTDVYVCMSTQTVTKQGKPDRTDRRADHAGFLRSLFLDVDVKPETYPTEADAVADMDRIIGAIGLPRPTFVIATGSGGRHLHWVTTEPLQPERWQKLADSLANAFEKHGAKIDFNVGVDCSRILRVPGTFNCKLPGMKRMVQMDPASTLQECNVLALETILHPYYGQGRARVSGGRRKKFIERPAAFVGVPMDPAFQRSTAPPYDDTARLPTAADLATGCPWVANMLAGVFNAHREPLWKEAMNVACHTAGGEATAHQLSSGAPGYSAVDTSAKYQTQKAAALGWPSCLAVMRAGAVECRTCPNAQVQGGSLFHFMRVVRTPGSNPPPAAPSAPAGFSLGATTAVLGLNGQPAGYGYDSNGIVTRKDDKGVAHPICSFPFFGGQLIRYAADDRRLRFETIVTSGARAEIELPQNEVSSDAKAMSLRLSKQDVVLKPEVIPLVRSFMSSWIETLSRDPANITAALPAFGWHGDGFVFGNRLYSPAGEVPVLSLAPVITAAYATAGDIAPWRAAVAMLLSRKNPGLNAILASTLAGPLVEFTAQHGLWLHVLSEGGGGKTTASRIAMAFWGNKHSKVGVNDTALSRLQKLETLRNITVFQDDLQITPERIGETFDFAMIVTSGQGRGRLTKEGAPRSVGEWSTFFSSTGNVSVRDAISEYSRKTAAAYTRVFEVTLPPVGTAGELAMGDADDIIGRVDDNYGHAAHAYAKYLGTNRAKVREMMKQAINTISHTHDCKPSARFWVGTMAALLVGAHIARHLGLIPFTDDDIAAMSVYLGEGLENNRDDMVAQNAEATPDAVANHVRSYINANAGEFGAILDQNSGQGEAMPRAYIIGGRMPVRLAIEINRATQTIWIDREHFRDWTAKRRVQWGTTLKQLKLLGMQEQTRALFAGSVVRGAAAKLLGVSMDHPNFPGLPR